MTLGPVKVMGAGVVVMMCVEEVANHNCDFTVATCITHRLSVKLIVIIIPYSGLFLRGKFHKLEDFHVKIFTNPQEHQHLLILALQYSDFVIILHLLATPHSTELIITINSSQLVQLLPFLLIMQVKTLDNLLIKITV